MSDIFHEFGITAGSTIGVGYLGTIVSGILYGVTCVQTFHYFRSVTKDHWIIKVLVLTLLVLDTLHQALIIHVFYWYLIDNYLNPIALLESVWSIGSEIIVNAVIAFLVESFLVYRVWKLSQNRMLAGLCEAFTVGHLTMNLVFPIRGLYIPNLLEAEAKLKTTGSSGLAVAVVTDVLISASLAFYLHKNRTGFHRSDTMIDKLIALTVTTGILTTVFVIANLIAYLTAPAALYVLFFNFMLGKLYINALLTSLNARSFISYGSNKGNSTSYMINSIPLHVLDDTAGSPDTKHEVTHQVAQQDVSIDSPNDLEASTSIGSFDIKNKL
ncbi:uncharacterized protein FIBRA_09106 [Fibroporia radiculosa]|uniref:DUF6534 domain-containing protein n=1 Tax=Fibroporia radiculosa TaxID=599839 RepID=J4GXY2_9APHY|nr:uncharacterized protein FIBRA_09106 [Fibroporia radiculosa]CCM06805.1 predicted protein [Fibroporia radiculosa]